VSIGVEWSNRLRDDLRVDRLTEHEGRSRLAEVVKAYARQTSPPQERIEARAKHLAGLAWGTHAARENKRLIAGRPLPSGAGG